MTGPAVDLAALRSARTALAAIVAEHPELTGATARARLAANLSEIIAMKPLDPNASGKARTITVRLSADLLAALDVEATRLKSLLPGSSIGLSDAVRTLLHRALATPSTSAPAAPAAPAPSRPVVARVEAVEAPAVDSRQLPLLTPAAPAIALHNAANGANVATPTGNDNAQEPTLPKPKRTRANGSTIDLDALKARLAAAVAARHTVKAIARLASVNDSGVIQWRKGATGLGPTVAGKLDVALTTLGH